MPSIRNKAYVNEVARTKYQLRKKSFLTRKLFFNGRRIRHKCLILLDRNYFKGKCMLTISKHRTEP